MGWKCTEKWCEFVDECTFKKSELGLLGFDKLAECKKDSKCIVTVRNTDENIRSSRKRKLDM